MRGLILRPFYCSRLTSESEAVIHIVNDPFEPESGIDRCYQGHVANVILYGVIFYLNGRIVT